LKAVPELYYGRVWDLLADNKQHVEEDWREELLQRLKVNYWYKQCKICKSKVPNEGVVLRKEGLGLEVYKHKNFDFLVKETKDAQ